MEESVHSSWSLISKLAKQMEELKQEEVDVAYSRIQPQYKASSLLSSLESQTVL